MFFKNGDDPKAKILHVMSASEVDVSADEMTEKYKKALDKAKQNETEVNEEEESK